MLSWRTLSDLGVTRRWRGELFAAERWREVRCCSRKCRRAAQVLLSGLVVEERESEIGRAHV